MAIESIKIPQNVYIEDRIVGPLTLKQIIIVTIGCGFSYALFSMISKTYGVVALPVEVLVWIPGVLSFVFAFVRINDLSMLKLCLLLLERMNKPSTRTWTPRRGIIINVRTFTTPNTNKQMQVATVIEQKQQRIAELSSVLDQPMSGVQAPADDLSPGMETPETAAADAAAMEKEAAQPVRRPVNPQRISATPLQGQPVDGVASAGSVSIFHDISPSSHA
ncbi:MAG TPA: PrgI family protein [Candidatus Peribacteraceae bacterium]|nr:PrgI family protein [Candidatus Peribacteraceae bacterium]